MTNHFPSVRIRRTGLWIKEQQERLEHEWESRRTEHHEYTRRSEESFYRFPDARKRRGLERSGQLWSAEYDKAQAVLAAVATLAKSVNDDDEFMLTTDEIALITTKFA